MTTGGAVRVFMLDSVRRGPRISRKFKLSEGFLAVTMDFQIRPSFRVRKSVCRRILSDGRHCAVAVLTAPESGVVLPQPDWKRFDSVAEGSVITILRSPPWRFWRKARKVPCWRSRPARILALTASASDTVSRYTLTKRKTVLRPPGFRMSSIPAGGRSACRTQPQNELPAGMAEKRRRTALCKLQGGVRYGGIRLARDASGIRSGGESRETRPCFAAPGVVNVLKNGCAGSWRICGGDVLAVTNVAPVFCTCAAHQDRARMKSLAASGCLRDQRVPPVGDSGQLAQKGAKLEIVPAEGVNLPSI